MKNMVRLIKLSREQELAVCGIAKNRGCSYEDVINEAIKLAILFEEIQSSGMDLFYGKKVSDECFDIVGIIEK